MVTFLKLGKYGRFANQCYQIAGVIGIATRNGIPYGFPEWVNHDHKNSFGSQEDVEVQKYFVNPLPGIDSRAWEERYIHWGYHDVQINGDVSIEGHLQSGRYFEHCIDLIRHYFKMKDEFTPTDACAVHWRAGDYIDDPQAYHPRMPKEYYESAFTHFPKDQKYLIFSDNTDEALKMFEQIPGIDFEIVKEKDYIQEFKLMKSCKHFIISNSSYSAFAATIADQPGKIVVSPSGYNWFGDVAGINGNDIVSSEWKQIRFEKMKLQTA